MREGDGERKVRVVGLGGLLSASPGRKPSVHTNLALRRRHTATTHALMSCHMHYATVFGRSSGKYLFPSLYDHGFRSLYLPTRGQLWNRRDHSPDRSPA